MESAREIVLIAHNLRSNHNVGSLLRTADGLGVKKVFLTGYTPYPASDGDSRLPHIANKVSQAIHKTALGAETMVEWEHSDNIEEVINMFKKADYKVFALEQTPGSVALPSFKPPDKCVIIVGREVEGLEPEVIARCDGVIEIPMRGKKESLNVVQAAAIALYHLAYA